MNSSQFCHKYLINSVISKEKQRKEIIIMNDQNERVNTDGMNPDSNNIENTNGEESVNFVLKESNGQSRQEQNGQFANQSDSGRPPYQGPYRANESHYYNGGRFQQDAYQNGPAGQNYYQNPYQSGGPGPGTNSHQPKKGGLAKKAAMVTAAALLFGTVSGGTMAGINALSNSFLTGNSSETAAPSLEVAPQTAASTEGAQPAQTAENSGAVVMDVSRIVEDVMPSMVSIDNTVLYTTQNWFYGSQTYEMPSSGSGIIVGKNDTELLIVTNNHVIQDSKEIKATFIDGTSVDAAVKGTDSQVDLAVIAVSLDQIPDDTKSKIKPAVLGDSSQLKMGQGVIAIGNALGYGQTTTVGYISAVDRKIQVDESGTVKNVIQTDAAINPGNSGGALVNMKGEVIGINEAKTSATSVEGVGYAIPVSEVQDIIQGLMNQKTRIAVEEDKQGYLGIQGTDVDERDATLYGMPKGAFVYKLVEDGAASQSDLQEKDIIVKIDNQPIRTMEELKEMLTYYESGSTVTMTVMRLENGQYVEKQVEIVLGSKPEEEPVNESGIAPRNRSGFWN